MKKIIYLIITLAFSSLLFVGCYEEPELIDPNSKISVPASQYDSEVATEWFALLKKLTKDTPGYTPPVAARSFGYTTVALYEAVRPGIPGNKSLVGQLNDLRSLSIPHEGKKYHWPLVANAVIAQMVKYYYSHTAQSWIEEINALEERFNTKYSADTEAEVIANSKEYGLTIAKEIYEWSKTDGGHEGYLNNFPTNYNPPTGPGYWVPTPPAFAKALQPYWGNNRPFIIDCVEFCQPDAPPAYSTDPNSEFYQEAYEVYLAVKNQTPEEKVIAEYWSDDPGTTATPPGHSISIVNQILQNENAKLDKAVEIFAKVGIALNDAFISCWKTKYKYNLVRPITYIKEVIDPQWMPTLVTPPFPEYASGHSVQSGALAQVLTDNFGENYAFTDRTHEDRTDINGTPRSYSSFIQMAEEAADSRLFGGIHYRKAIDLGLKQGYDIGKVIGRLQFK